MIWNESIECMDRESLRKIQSIRLKKTVERVYHDTPFYRKKMQELGVTPDDINSIDDIVKLPFTTKYDLRDNYPFGLCAVPMSQIVRIHASSGTTGKPTVVGYTRKDLSAWSECLSRAFTAYGAGSSDIFQVSYGYGLFTGGLGAHAGAENIGASVIPMSSGNTEKQITLMHDFGSTVLCCTPSYALYLADAIKDSGLPREEFKLKVGAFGAEPWTESMRRDIETKLGIKAFDIYGLSEIAGPGVGYECECQHGTHLNEDHYFPEIVDPKTLEPVAPGETGELVFTHLTKEGMPLLRKESLEAMARDFSALDEKERAILRLGFRAEDGTERLGSPVLFGSSYFGALCSLPEGKGGGVVIRQHPESVRAVYAARQEELEDADTAEELERLRKLL